MFQSNIILTMLQVGLQAAIEDAILWLPQLFVNENLSVRIVGIEVVVAFASHRELQRFL